MTQPILFFIVLGAFAVEAAVGFGATLITVAFGSMLLPIDALLTAFVPVNLVMSSLILARHHHHVELRWLVLRVLPFAAIGLPIGMFLSDSVDEGVLKFFFGVFVLVLALTQLAVRPSLASAPAEVRPQSHFDRLLLVLGGVVHGAFASGGPMIVYVLGKRWSGEKEKFRATLSMIWWILNGILVAKSVATGALDRTSLDRGALMFVAMLVGLYFGESLHRKVPQATFRRYVFGMLAVIGIVTISRTATSLGLLF